MAEEYEKIIAQLAQENNSADYGLSAVLLARYLQGQPVVQAQEVISLLRKIMLVELEGARFIFLDNILIEQFLATVCVGILEGDTLIACDLQETPLTLVGDTRVQTLRDVKKYEASKPLYAGHHSLMHVNIVSKPCILPRWPLFI